MYQFYKTLEKTKKSVAFYISGCKLNFAETSTIARQLLNEGFTKVLLEW